MKMGDNVIIRYSDNTGGAATFLGAENGKNYFFDRTGKFILTDDFITRSGITITVLDDDF